MTPNAPFTYNVTLSYRSYMSRQPQGAGPSIKR